jgi:hypothetical protein
MSIAIDSALRAPPERITVRTCFGCGAMGRLGGCDTGCHERPVELVRAAAFDEVAAVRSSARAAVDAFRAVVEDLAWRHPGSAEDESSYWHVQGDARTVLQRFPHRPGDEDVTDTPTESTAASWCGQCETIESFQPCIEVCIWREAEWVSAGSYRQERERALAELTAEARLRGLLQRLAWVTPLEGQWRTCLRVLQAEARQTLEAAAHGGPIAA